MNWVQREMSHFSAPYRVYHETRGYSAWLYGKDGAACLGRQLTLKQALELCAEHKAKQA